MYETIRMLVIPSTATPTLETVESHEFIQRVEKFISGPVEAIELTPNLQLLINKYSKNVALAINTNIRQPIIRGTALLIQHDENMEPVSLSDAQLQTALKMLGTTYKPTNRSFTEHRRFLE